MRRRRLESAQRSIPETALDRNILLKHCCTAYYRDFITSDESPNINISSELEPVWKLQDPGCDQGYGSERSPEEDYVPPIQPPICYEEYEAELRAIYPFITEAFRLKSRSTFYRDRETPRDNLVAVTLREYSDVYFTMCLHGLRNNFHSQISLGGPQQRINTVPIDTLATAKAMAMRLLSALSLIAIQIAVVILISISITILDPRLDSVHSFY
ncbi:hypothetical protein EVAR_19236_1 [Eumeta japonica]|uniref:Uncharacterized protein n=1 Tax=Eumeta variegata TaxID=151549 RepID=A0A4C1VFP0_EUMVA|nr:hypothetical protein EVAR_19236_1 [Eumeta japonica]